MPLPLPLAVFEIYIFCIVVFLGEFSGGQVIPRSDFALPLPSPLLILWNLICITVSVWLPQDILGTLYVMIAVGMVSLWLKNYSCKRFGCAATTLTGAEVWIDLVDNLAVRTLFD